MKKAIGLIVLLFAVGCRATTTYTGPYFASICTHDPNIAIPCGFATRCSTLDNCYEWAGKHCPNGYSMVAVAETHSLIVECK
jgi:hypothetical protein